MRIKEELHNINEFNVNLNVETGKNCHGF